MEVIDKEESDCYRLAQYYEQHFGREKLINHIIKYFFKEKWIKHINALLQLPVYEFWTTNYDKIIENTIEIKQIYCPLLSTIAKILLKSMKIKNIRFLKWMEVFRTVDLWLLLAMIIAIIKNHNVY